MKYLLVDKYDEVVTRVDLGDDIGISGARTYFVGTKKLNEEEFDKMAEKMTVKGYADKVKCPTLLATGEFDPLCPLEDAVEVYEDLTCKKELWVIEDQFHPLWGCLLYTSPSPRD